MIKTMRILQQGNPALRRPATDVTEIDGHVMAALRRMELAMRAARGIGLAANQIGYEYNMFIIAPGGKSITAINPRIVDVSDKLVYDTEGCLSIRGKSFIIPRPEWVTTEWLDQNGNLIQGNYTDMYARCVMHEIDHLSGKLISDLKDDNDNVPFRERAS